MEALEQGGAYDSLASEAAFSRCMDFLARMIQKYGPEIKFPDSEAEEQVGTERGGDVIGIPAALFLLTQVLLRVTMLLGQILKTVFVRTMVVIRRL